MGTVRISCDGESPDVPRLVHRDHVQMFLQRRVLEAVEVYETERLIHVDLLVYHCPRSARKGNLLHDARLCQN